MVSAGFVVAVAAGNGNFAGTPIDACTDAPAGAPNVITVGSTTNTDAESSFSNYGTCVDLLAPGVAVTVADGEATGTITDTTALTVSIADAATVDEGGNLIYTVTLSGTSTTAITVPVTYTGTAADGSDYTSVAFVTIPAAISCRRSAASASTGSAA